MTDDKKIDRVGEALNAIARCSPQEILLVTMMMQTITHAAAAAAGVFHADPPTCAQPEAAPSKVPASETTEAAPSKASEDGGFAV